MNKTQANLMWNGEIVVQDPLRFLLINLIYYLILKLVAWFFTCIKATDNFLNLSSNISNIEFIVHTLI